MSAPKHRLGLPTANVYVDGFNLYYGALKGGPNKWLDLGALFGRLVPTHQIKRIRYFTARITARPADLDAPVRQQTYLRALRTLPNLTLHLGHFLESHVWMPLAQQTPGGPPVCVEVIKTEEKGSDVNLATYLLTDAFRHDSDLAIVVSNDSDLCEPIRIVKSEFGVPVALLTPYKRQTSRALSKLQPQFIKQIRPGPLSASQFPNQLTDAHGKIVKPAAW